jgi:hypothetical protein
MVSGFGCEVWASVQMTASRSLCLTQHSLPITRLFIAVRGAFWVLLSFGSLFCSRFVLIVCRPSDDGWSERRANCSSEIKLPSVSLKSECAPA